MKTTIIVLSLVCIFLMTGCAYTRVQVPMDRDFTGTTLGTKEGRSNTKSVLWLVAWGDGGTRAAAMDGDISVIHHADVEFYSILLGLYSRTTTIVYGD